MPSRKQRRRREKLQRHEYEYVVETDEGEEVVESPRDLEPDTPPKAARNGKSDRSKASGAKASRARAAKSAAGPLDRRGRPVPKPSLERSMKRALIFLPIFVLFLYVAAPDLTVTQKLIQAVLLMLVFVPVTYLADKMVYRTALRRWEQQRGGGRRS
jgi:hypothetical protein